jgi:hypothetical protein
MYSFERRLRVKVFVKGRENMLRKDEKEGGTAI